MDEKSKIDGYIAKIKECAYKMEKRDVIIWENGASITTNTWTGFSWRRSVFGWWMKRWRFSWRSGTRRMQRNMWRGVGNAVDTSPSSNSSSSRNSSKRRRRIRNTFNRVVVVNQTSRRRRLPWNHFTAKQAIHFSRLLLHHSNLITWCTLIHVCAHEISHARDSAIP